MDLRNCLVRFKIRDVHVPDPEALAMELYANDLAQGTVVDLSDSGSQKDAFAVIKVEGVKQLVIVATHLVTKVTGPASRGAKCHGLKKESDSQDAP